jgi:parvulin-like peptidyl-prolyl isomerase
MKKLLSVLFLSLVFVSSTALAEDAVQKETTPSKETVTVAEPAKAEAPKQEAAQAQPKAEEPKKEAVTDTVLIDVNGTPIYKKEVLDALEYTIKPIKEISEEDFLKVLANIQDFLVDIAIVENEAKKKGLTITDEEFNTEYQKMIDRDYKTKDKLQDILTKTGMSEDKFKSIIRGNLLRNKFLYAELEPKIIVTDEEVKAFYESHKGMMINPETVRVSHILIKAPKEDPEKKKMIENLKKDIESGKKTFEEVAKNFSDCPSARNGGDLGSIKKGQTVKEFEDMAFKLEIGQLSDIVKTEYGYHIIKVMEKNPEKQVTIEEAKESIVNFIKNTKRKEVFQTFMADLKKNAKINIDQANQILYKDVVPAEKQVKKSDEAVKSNEQNNPEPSEKKEASGDAPAAAEKK